MSQPAGGARIDFIQALRGIAAAMVMLYHLHTTLAGTRFGDVGATLFNSGAAGVDLFFVISGFIMVHTTRRADGSPRYAAEFLAKRIARVWPVYAIATLVFSCALDLLVGQITVDQGWRSLARALVFYPHSSLGAPFFRYQPLFVGWSLGYEVWFYLLFAASLLAGRWRWPAFAALFGAFVIAIPLAVTGDVHADAYVNYALPGALLRLAANPMMWDFIAGIAIALVYHSRFAIRSRLACWLCVAAAVAGEAWVLATGYRAGQGPTNWMPGLAIVVLVLAIANKPRPIAVPRWLVWLGDVSFSLYLVHPFASYLLPKLVFALTRASIAHAITTGLPFFAFQIALSLALAALGHRYLERGVAERARRWLLGRL